MGFKSVILVVDDVMKSRKIYEEMLGCKVEMDFGIYNVGFAGGLALYKKSFFSEMIGSKEIVANANNLAVYFEYDDINTIRDMAIKSELVLVHDIKEQSWGQKLFRFYDYDKHIIEVAENMNVVLKKMYRDGMSITMISEKTGYKLDEVTKILKELQSEKMVHVVYCDDKEMVLEKILAGTKTMIIRSAAGRKIPHSRVFEGENLYFMKKGTGLITATADVTSVQNYVKLSEDEINKVFTDNQNKLNLSEKQKARWHKKCICLIEFANVKEIDGLEFDHQGNMDDWLIVEKIEDVLVGTSIPYNYEKSRF